MYASHAVIVAVAQHLDRVCTVSRAHSRTPPCSLLHWAALAGERAGDRAGMHAQEKQPLGLPDRVVKITGTPDQLLRAVALLLTKLVESPNYTRFTTSNVSYGPPLAPVRPLLV